LLFCGPIVFAALTSLASAQAAPDGPDLRYTVAIRIDGAPVQGAAERGARLKGKPAAEQNAILAEPLPALSRKGHRLQVMLKGPDGIWRDVTGSHRIRFEHMGCLAILSTVASNSTGATQTRSTIAPAHAGTCLTPTLPMLYVIALNEQGQALNFNEYAFQIRP
jgi:hypothetical protein